MIINDEYSIKGTYKFIQFVAKICKYDVPYQRIKEIIFNRYAIESKEEIKIYDLSNSYIYLLNNSNQRVDQHILKQSYYLLASEELDENIISKIMEMIYLNVDKSIFYLAAILHFYILGTKLEKKKEYAFILSNYLILKKTTNPIIINSSNINQYESIIKSQDSNKLSLLFFLSTKKYKNITYSDVTLEEILNKLKKIKNIIQNEYKVKKLFIFGSITRDILLPCSDIDLIVIFEELTTNYEQKSFVGKLKKYLEEVFNREVDILNFSSALKNYDITDLEKMITVI